MAGRKERLIHLLLRERLGGHTPPDLSRSIMDRIDGRAAPVHQLPPAPKPFSPWMAVAASIAIVAALALGVSAWLLNRDNGVERTPTAEDPKVIPSQQEREGLPIERTPLPDPVKTPEPKPEPEPEPRKPDDRIETPTPEPQPEPREPDDTVETPVPEPEPEPTPEPKKPDDTVETPDRPQPEPTPEPEPTKPDDTVETPEPPKPDRPPTESDLPKEPVKLGSILYVAERGKLTYRMNDDERWQDWVVGSPVLSGMHLKVRRPAAVELPEGARFYFDGEIIVRGDDASLEVQIIDEQVYFDVYGSEREFTARRNDASLVFRDAEVLVERSGARLQVTCLGGEVKSGEVTLQAGWTAALSDKGLSRAKYEGSRARTNILVASMDGAFVLMREELNEEARKRVYCGDLKDGVVKGATTKDAAFGIEFADSVEVQERGFVRMRIRVTGSPDGLSIGFGSGEESVWTYFQSHHEKVANGAWVILRVPLSRLKDDGKEKHIWPGVKLRKFQIVLWTKENAHVEVDWFELGVDPEWNVKEDK